MADVSLMSMQSSYDCTRQPAFGPHGSYADFRQGEAGGGTRRGAEHEALMVELFTDDAWIIAVSAIAIALAAVAAWLSGRPDDQSDDDPADH